MAAAHVAARNSAPQRREACATSAHLGRSRRHEWHDIAAPARGGDVQRYATSGATSHHQRAEETPNVQSRGATSAHASAVDRATVAREAAHRAAVMRDKRAAACEAAHTTRPSCATRAHGIARLARGGSPPCAAAPRLISSKNLIDPI
ncbi:putative histone-lysine N-methyltransferase ATXR3-like [Dorcoceras hygrometricum]|uniref:Putative histone-lysine N-methyltransferase ATXR3-like n=1 Tax=Dorcoceras hygrometricum TaxID=472368 RepID=A0A2Z7CN93_9LAMI|nr:putative histone-lysine N-methyltransferase ATXR3-like [Dorcoceras hygrometricum]